MKTNPCRHCNGSGKEPDRDAVGPALVKLRKASNVKQKDIAEFLDISAGHLCDIESGKKWCSLELYTRYKTAVNKLKSKNEHTGK